MYETFMNIEYNDKVINAQIFFGWFFYKCTYYTVWTKKICTLHWYKSVQIFSAHPRGHPVYIISLKTESR